VRAFFRTQQPLLDQGILFVEASLSHSDTPALGRTPLEKWSARRRDLYVTTHNTHTRHTFSPGGVQTYHPSKQAALIQALHSASTSIGNNTINISKF